MPLVHRKPTRQIKLTEALQKFGLPWKDVRTLRSKLPELQVWQHGNASSPLICFELELERLLSERGYIQPH
jgi:hypothetical protein